MECRSKGSKPTTDYAQGKRLDLVVPDSISITPSPRRRNPPPDGTHNEERGRTGPPSTTCAYQLGLTLGGNPAPYGSLAHAYNLRHPRCYAVVPASSAVVKGALVPVLAPSHVGSLDIKNGKIFYAWVPPTTIEHAN